MSSLAPLPTLSVPAGAGAVNAAALDAVIASLVDKLNQIVAAVNAPRNAAGRLRQLSIVKRNLSAEARQSLAAVIANLVLIRQSYDTNFDPRQTITVTPTSVDVDEPVRFGIGQPAPTPDFTAPMTIPGLPGVAYEMIFRLRSVSRRAGVVPEGTVNGYSAGNRLLVTPTLAIDQTIELLGLEVPGTFILINASTTSGDFLLQEDSEYLLLEDDGNILV